MYSQSPNKTGFLTAGSSMSIVSDVTADDDNDEWMIVKPDIYTSRPVQHSDLSCHPSNCNQTHCTHKIKRVSEKVFHVLKGFPIGGKPYCSSLNPLTI